MGKGFVLASRGKRVQQLTEDGTVCSPRSALASTDRLLSDYAMTARKSSKFLGLAYFYGKLTYILEYDLSYETEK